MKRTRMAFLGEWLKSSERKPLVIRGARQVGKTWLVRHFAKTEGLKLIEVNFERKSHNFASFFTSDDPKRVLLNLEAAFDISIDQGNSLLFLDEIQAAPEILAKLRWFYEDLPGLPVIAAGSLLEFVLEAHSFSMPVGRINYMHLEPLSFEEFLLASEKKGLFNYLQSYQMDTEIPLAIHNELMELFKEYIIVGGMPAAVSSWVGKKSLQTISQIHHNLMATYQDDIGKYKGRIETDRVLEVLFAVPKQLGEKFVFSHINPAMQVATCQHALSLLSKARVCHPITCCAANGVPLEAEIQDKNQKFIFLDVGLCSAALGLSFDQVYQAQEISLINKGGIAEQVVGQILRTILPPFIQPALYYWRREHKGSSAEVDYIAQHGSSVLPIEVKAGSTGSLKSLHYFMGQKGFSFALRVNSDLPSQVQVEVKDHQGEIICYTLLSLPFYLLGQLHRLM